MHIILFLFSMQNKVLIEVMIHFPCCVNKYISSNLQKLINTECLNNEKNNELSTYKSHYINYHK